MALGGDGIISVVSNATPRADVGALRQDAAPATSAGARELHFTLLPWMRAAFVESNPMPVKAALAMMGRIQNVAAPSARADGRHAQRRGAFRARRARERCT